MKAHEKMAEAVDGMAESTERVEKIIRRDQARSLARFKPQDSGRLDQRC